MLFDDVLKNPALRKAIAEGEEVVGKTVARFLADERVASGVQTLLASAGQARAAVERGVQQALHAANLPSAEDVQALKRRLDDLEAMIDGLAEKVGRGPRGG